MSTDPIDRRTFLQTSVLVPALSTIAARTLLAQGGAERVSLSAKGLRLDLDVARNKPLLFQGLRNQVTGFEWAQTGAVVEPLVASGGKAHHGWTWQERSRKRTKTGERLEVVSQDAPDVIHTTLAMQAMADLPFVEWRAEFQNTGTQPIAGVQYFGPLRLPLRKDLGHLRFYVFPKGGPPQIHDVPAGASETPISIDGGYGGSPGGAYGGIVLLEAVEQGEFLMFGIEWDLNLHIQLDSTEQGRTLVLAVGGLRHDVAPGEKLAAPPVFLGATRAPVPGDFEHALNVTRDYLQRHVFPVQRKDMPWIVYNIWGTEPTGVEETIRKEIDFAARIGVEMLYVDASWYKGSSKKGTGDWGCGLGNYEEDREKFPAGLAALSRATHAAGMKFGLWVAPHTVDSRIIGPTISTKWLVDPNNGPGFQADGWENDIRGVCLGCTEYFQYVRTNLLRIVKEYGLDWLKWDDSPGIAQCSRADHGHQAGDGLYNQMRNKYLIFEELHRKFPNLVIEQCAATLDYAPARYVRANWLSDSTYPSSAVRRNAFAGSYIYPSAYNGAWIVQVDPEFNTLAQGDPALLDTAYRSRMLGAFGFGTLTGKLSERASLYPESVLAAARRNIPVYKRYRHLLATDCYHLSTADGSESNWEAIQFITRAGDESVVLSFRGKSSQSERALKLRGVVPTRTYEVTSVNSGKRTRLRGEVLLKDGFPVTLDKPQWSEILLLRVV